MNSLPDWKNSRKPEPEHQGITSEPSRFRERQPARVLGRRVGGKGIRDGDENAQARANREDSREAGGPQEKPDQERHQERADAEEEAHAVERGRLRGRVEEEVRHERVARAVDRGAADAEQGHRGEELGVASGPGHRQEGRPHDEGSRHELQLHAVAVLQRAEREARGQHAGVQDEEERAHAAQADLEPLREEGEDGAEERRRDPVQEHPGEGRGLKPARGARAHAAFEPRPKEESTPSFDAPRGPAVVPDGSAETPSRL